MYYINNFFVYSIIGFLLETVFFFIFHQNGESGILFGPWTPIYGFGIVLTFYVNKRLEQKLQNSKIRNVLLFIIMFIFLTVLEWVGGVVIEKIWNISYWNYNSFAFHFGKYISFETSLLWGVGAVFTTCFVKPYTDFVNKRIPKFITYLLIILIGIDGIFSVFMK